ncbi:MULTISPECIES: protein-export chaperone SecB [Lactobacillaceae]|uniref:protein-export chaperone SecB n=1 Tax=Lactobacillaceae TaxID=33958 RepID=UPI0005516D6A|nr:MULTISPECIES: protein-export chaperone SecB [Lactobacillaceae]
MTVLNFKGYRVLDMSYTQNEQFKSSQEKLSFNPNFGVNLVTDDNDEAKVTLTFVLENELPFNIKVTLEGSFKYNASEDEANIGLDELLKKNATAILFPYLRAIVSQLTSMGNEYQPLLIPAMNIGALLDENNTKIKK